MRKIKISLILNIINIIFILFATIAMITNFRFMTNEGVLEIPGVNALQFFTVDSNLLLGISSIIMVVYEVLLLNGKITSIPKYVYLFKFISTVATTLTMMTVVVLLGPIAPTGYFSLFINSNFFFHLVSPLLGVISYVFFENHNLMNKKEILYGLLPTFLYGIYYTTNVLIHMENGKVPPANDWYGFAQGGVVSIIIYVVLMFGTSLLFSFLLYFGNKKLYKEN